MARLRPGHLIALAGPPLLAATILWASAAETGFEHAVPWARPLAERVDAAFPRAVPRSVRRQAVGDRVIYSATADAVAIPRLPGRIVAGSVLSAEVLLAIAPAGRVAGVIYLAADARYSAVAAAAAAVPQVGAEPEQLLAVRPDLVITDEFTSAATLAMLARASVPVVRTRPIADFVDVADNLRLIGWASGCDAAAEGLIEAMQSRIAGLARRADEVRAWRVLNLSGALDTYGSGTLLDAAMRLAGVTNVAAEHGVVAFRTLDVETVLAWRPDALLIAAYPGQEQVVWSRLQQDPGLRLLPCVERARVVLVANAIHGSVSHHAVGTAEVLQARLQAWGRP